ncbi:hypothetical protein DFH08DRAFT_889241 [Mycena albidolilacea]|uniref:Secreted protein n=1 Tax=Mycena albidolilacea TaxID=1033008 RepID=A0AAD7EG35_9AGAR|nr:hypothetical protein DFH08DRAFT_889241 [Mycena albidolilacea]
MIFSARFVICFTTLLSTAPLHGLALPVQVEHRGIVTTEDLGGTPSQDSRRTPPPPDWKRTVGEFDIGGFLKGF